MTDKNLRNEMNVLVGQAIRINPTSNTKEEITQYRQIIAKAVQLGMDYQEQKIKEGIDIVFKALHEKMEVS